MLLSTGLGSGESLVSTLNTIIQIRVRSEPGQREQSLTLTFKYQLSNLSVLMRKVFINF